MMCFLIAAVLPPSPADSDSGVSSDLESSSDDKLRLQGTNNKIHKNEHCPKKKTTTLVLIGVSNQVRPEST